MEIRHSPEPLSYSHCDAVVVLGAFMKPIDVINQDGSVVTKWTLPSITEERGKPSIIGGKSRAIAAAQLYSMGVTQEFWVTGGTQKDSRDQEASRAQVLADHIIKYGVPESAVRVIGKPGHGNTIGNFIDTIDHMKSLPQIKPHFKLGILSNTWQMLRTLAFIDRMSELAYLRENAVDLLALPAEIILGSRSARHGRWALAFMNHPLTFERLMEEVSGIEAILNGSYKPHSS